MLHLLCLNVNSRYWKRWYCMVLCSSHAIALDEGTEVRECNTHKKKIEKKEWKYPSTETSNGNALKKNGILFFHETKRFRSTRDKRCMCDRRAHLHRNGSISCILRSTLRWKSLSVKEVLAEGMVHGLSILCIVARCFYRSVFRVMRGCRKKWISHRNSALNKLCEMPLRGDNIANDFLR